ncbi:4'-phosphopantetheinyl transferase superfamily protein [Streptomyces sp. NPDC040724]|uniref:4'-phosphopantetheinyl transferase family protein n=1 Tax=Streptomyces sp. NPDC040724 TaxID=3155612 RepID=UPI0033E3988C
MQHLGYPQDRGSAPHRRLGQHQALGAVDDQRLERGDPGHPDGHWPVPATLIPYERLVEQRGCGQHPHRDRFGCFVSGLPSQAGRTLRPLGQFPGTGDPGCWTRKEAVLKAIGVGLASDLTRLETHPATPGPVEVTSDALGTPSTWWVSDLEVPEGWTAALALAGGPAPASA